MAKVILFEPVDYDVAAAATYGEVTYLYRTGEERPSLFDERIRGSILMKLLDMGYDPDEDYIAATGSVAKVALMLGVAACRFEHTSILNFDARDRVYKHMRLK